jgi:hypothetical protein
MATKFDNGTINLTSTPNPLPPQTSQDLKLFQENGTLKTVDFAGNVKPVGTEIKIAKAEVNTTEDAVEYVIRVPSPNAKLEALEKNLNALIKTTSEANKAAIETALGTLNDWKSSQELANGVFDSALIELNDRLENINDSLNDKASKEELNSSISIIATDLLKVVNNINSALTNKASKSELEAVDNRLSAKIASIKIPSVPTIVADSGNVNIDYRGNEVGISVDIPQIVQKVVQTGGGVSRSVVQSMIDSSIEGISGGSGGGIPEAPIDGSLYGRKNGGWEVVSVSGSVTVPTSGDFLGGYDARYLNSSGDTFTGTLIGTNIQASNSSGFHLKNQSGNDVLSLGAGGGNGATFAGGVIVGGLSGNTSEIVTVNSVGLLQTENIRLVELTTINGDDATLSYSSGTLTSKTTSKGTQTFNYDGSGNLISISGSGEYRSKSFSYDGNGNLTNIEVI